MKPYWLLQASHNLAQIYEGACANSHIAPVDFAQAAALYRTAAEACPPDWVWVREELGPGVLCTGSLRVHTRSHPRTHEQYMLLSTPITVSRADRIDASGHLYIYIKHRKTRDTTWTRDNTRPQRHETKNHSTTSTHMLPHQTRRPSSSCTLPHASISTGAVGFFSCRQS